MANPVDNFSGANSVAADAPLLTGVTITPTDNVNLPFVTRAINVSVACSLSVQMLGIGGINGSQDAPVVLFFPAGTTYVRVYIVNATGSTLNGAVVVALQ